MTWALVCGVTHELQASPPLVTYVKDARNRYLAVDLPYFSLPLVAIVENLDQHLWR